MQCSSCRAVYSNGLETCPRCKTPASINSPVPDATPAVSSDHEETMGEPSAMTEESLTNDGTVAAATSPVSTLIEFPGAWRAARPQWRKQLSERVREIQERRAREAAREAEEAARRSLEQPAVEPSAPQLGLVPQPDAPQINPLVAAALRRIERAHQSAPPAPRGRSGGGAAQAAVARFVEDEYQPETNRARMEASATLPKPDERPSEVAARERGLIVVPAPQTAARAVAVEERKEASPQPVTAKVADESLLKGTDAQASATTAPLVEPYDDQAALHKRFVAAVIDLLVVAFAASPFAAIIELTNGNWSDMRVAASMGGIILVIMFLYLAASTALGGRTWGMSLLSLRAVDVETGEAPTTKQSVARALLFMVSLAAAGIGILYALFDAEGRAAHDHFSGTVVVRE